MSQSVFRGNKPYMLRGLSKPELSKLSSLESFVHFVAYVVNKPSRFGPSPKYTLVVAKSDSVKLLQGVPEIAIVWTTHSLCRACRIWKRSTQEAHTANPSWNCKAAFVSFFFHV